MGNHMCRSGFISKAATPSGSAIIRVIKSDGLVKIYDRPINVSVLTAKFPNHKACKSDSLYIGQKIAALSEDDELQLGHTYFLLPIHFFHSVLTFLAVTSFAASKAAASSNCQLFEVQKTESGFLRIRVRDEFISRLMMMKKKAQEEEEDDDPIITKRMMNDENIINIPSSADHNTAKREGYCHQGRNFSWSSSGSNKNVKLCVSDDSYTGSRVCTTPELHKEYQQLVLIRRGRWKPKLDMIKESRNNARKVLIIPASFRPRKRSSISSRSSITGGTTSAPATDSNNRNSNIATSSNSRRRIHKIKMNKPSLLQGSSKPLQQLAHHLPIAT